MIWIDRVKKPAFRFKDHSFTDLAGRKSIKNPKFFEGPLYSKCRVEP